MNEQDEIGENGLQLFSCIHRRGQQHDLAADVIIVYARRFISIGGTE